MVSILWCKPSAAPPNVPASEYGDELAYIMGVEDAVDQYSQYITQAFNAGSNALTNYPDNSLADQLKTIARLVKEGGLKPKSTSARGRLRYPRLANSTIRHPLRLRPLRDPLCWFSDAISYFSYDDLDGMGLADKIVACTFSEFGRCARENGSAGTDHGTRAYVYLRKALSGGVHGTNVDLVNLAGDNQLQGLEHRLPPGVYHFAESTGWAATTTYWTTSHVPWLSEDADHEQYVRRHTGLLHRHGWYFRSGTGTAPADGLSQSGQSPRTSWFQQPVQLPGNVVAAQFGRFFGFRQ